MLDGSPWPGLARRRGLQEEPGQTQKETSIWLEGLRFGTVAGSARLLTVGRRRELAQIRKDLSQTLELGGACRILCGAYGVGKSHLLECGRQRALKEGLATATAVLDRKKICASQPRRLLRELLLNLKLPGQNGRGVDLLDSVLDRAVEKPSAMLSDPLMVHRYLSPALKAWSRLPKESPIRSQILHWLSGGERTQNARLRRAVKKETGHDPGAFYALKDHRTVWNQMTYLLTGWCALFREGGWAKGLMVVLDEAEMCALSSGAHQVHSDRTLSGLCAAALGRRGVLRPRLLAQRGGHHAVKEFPSYFQSRSHLYLALGLATESEGREALATLVPSQHFSELSGLGEAAVQDLLEEILRAYRYAFPHFPLGPGFAVPLGQLLTQRGEPLGTPRQLVQQALGFLDGARLWRGPMDEYVEGFVERYD